MRNPIIGELKKLKLISNSDLIILNNKTRDKKIKVYQDKKTKIIFLEKYIKSKYPITPKDKPENLRRANQFKKILKNKDILDFGCAWGGFLKKIKNSKSLSGVEQRKECINYVKKKLKKIKISDDINSFNRKFDIITMFHVLEHIPYQLEILKLLKSKLKNKGKIIIEVPHAEDFLIIQNELKEFKNFTFWSEHLILHTCESIKAILSKAGFKNIKIEYYQRHNFANHLGWFLKRKPGGHEFNKNIVSKKLNNIYMENLKSLKKTDTIIATAE
tara:strand:+ start:160 stop:978 length:819 start_codon:yes stop_codon:yes gene_type:complete